MSKILKLLGLISAGLILTVILIAQIFIFVSLQTLTTELTELKSQMQEEQTNTGQTTNTPTPTISATPNNKLKTIKIFVKNYKNDPSVLDCKADDFVEREIPNSQDYLQDALNTLFTLELTAAEKAEGLKNIYTDDSKSSENLELQKAILTDKIANISLNDPDNFTSGGSCRSGILLSALEKTVKQFNGIDSVQVLPEGTSFQP